MKKYINLIIGGFLVAIILIAAVVSYIWLPFDPKALNFASQLKAPSSAHLFGTDHFGRDLFSRILVGARGTLYVGVIAVGIALTTGSFLGLIAGYFGGLLDEIVMRLTDTFYAFPAILLALLLAGIFGPSTVTAMTAIGIATIPIFARLMRSSTLTIKELPYIEAARALGMSHFGIILRHVLPNTLSPIIVQASLSLAIAVLAEAALSYLGLGSPPDVPSWGNMLREAKGFMNMSIYPALVPGLAIVITVLGWGLLGDGLRDVLDPHNNN